MRGSLQEDEILKKRSAFSLETRAQIQKKEKKHDEMETISLHPDMLSYFSYCDLF